MAHNNLSKRQCAVLLQVKFAVIFALVACARNTFGSHSHKERIYPSGSGSVIVVYKKDHSDSKDHSHSSSSSRDGYGSSLRGGHRLGRQLRIQYVQHVQQEFYSSKWKTFDVFLADNYIDNYDFFGVSVVTWTMTPRVETSFVLLKLRISAKVLI